MSIDKKYPQVTLVSTSFYRLSREVERARALAGLRGLENAAALGIPVVLIDGGSDEQFLHEATARGAILHRQRGKTLGAARREAVAHGVSTGATHLIYTEIEKDTFIQDLPRALDVCLQQQVQICIPARRSLLSYPPFQRQSETLLNTFFLTLTGVRLDIAFGPRIWHTALSSYFLDYQGEYGDSWDSIFIPVVRALADGVQIQSVTVAYDNPAEQTAAERGVVTMELKRLVQLTQISEGMFQEWEKIKLSRSQKGMQHSG